MVLRVDKVLGIVHDLHGRAAVDRQLDAVLGGQGVLDDLLGAVRMDEHGHRAGFHVGNGDLDLGVAGILGQLDLDGGGGIAVAGSLDLHGSLHRLAVLLRVLDGLAAESGLRRGLAVLVGLHRAGGAVSGLGLGDGAAVGVGGGLSNGAILLGLSLDLGAVGLGLGLNLGAVGLGGGSRIRLAGAGGGPAGAAATAGGAAAGRRDRRGLRVQHNLVGQGLVVGGILGSEYPLVFHASLDLGGHAQFPRDRTRRRDVADGQICVAQLFAVFLDEIILGRAVGLGLFDGDGNGRLRLSVVSIVGRREQNGLGAAVRHIGNRLGVLPSPSAFHRLAIEHCSTLDFLLRNSFAGVGYGDVISLYRGNVLIRHGQRNGDGIVRVVGAGDLDRDRLGLGHIGIVLEGEFQLPVRDGRLFGQKAARRRFTLNRGLAALHDQGGQIHRSAGALLGKAAGGLVAVGGLVYGDVDIALLALIADFNRGLADCQGLAVSDILRHIHLCAALVDGFDGDTLEAEFLAPCVVGLPKITFGLNALEFVGLDLQLDGAGHVLIVGHVVGRECPVVCIRAYR